MIHHFSFGITDTDRARRFYDAVLGVLGMRLLAEENGALGYGVNDYLFSLEQPVDGKPATAGNGTHVAFQARDRATVHAFHEAALANGGTDAGAPGLRPNYDPNYYGAFALDPDGNKVEAVTFSGR